MAILVIDAESGDWSGIAETFIWVTDEYTEKDDADAALRSFMEKYSGQVEEAIFKYYGKEDFDEDGNGSVITEAYWWTEELGWDWNSSAYHIINDKE